MKDLFSYDPLSLSELIIPFVVGFTLIFIFKKLSRISENVTLSSGKLIPIGSVLNKIEVLTEPIIIIVLAGKLVSVHPIYHGILLPVFTAILFPVLRDYFNGRIVLFSNDLIRNGHVKTGHTEGSIIKKTRLGVFLRTDTGKQYIRYSELLKYGLTMPGKEISTGYCYMRITPRDNSDHRQVEERIFDLLITMPYIDRSFKPKIKSTGKDNSVNIKVLTPENVNAETIALLFNENGFSCTQIHKKEEDFLSG